VRPLTQDFAAAMAGGATTLAYCWTVTRKDGAVLGFTDHDRDLTLAGVTCAAASAFEAADLTSELGFATGGGDVAGALSAPGLTEADIAGGLYDGATVAVWLVDWSDPNRRLLLDTGVIGEIRRGADAFVAEFRTLSARLDEERGRMFGPTCDADLGDARCKVDMSAPGRTVTATVLALEGEGRLRVSGLEAYPDGWFDQGRLRVTSGQARGFESELREQRQASTGTTLEPWTAPLRAIAVGDLLSVAAGCDKSFGLCRTKFANTMNFRGFPHMPGNNELVRIARAGDPGMDGGSLNR
jgi:uncharacterized phage protein (TIGR02218 family)